MHLTRIFGLLALVALLGGCVVTEQDLITQRKLMDLQRRVDESDRTLKMLTEGQGGSLRERLEALASNQADLQAGLDGLRVDVQSMQGRSDDLALGRDDARQELALLRDELSLQLADLEQRITGLEQAGVPSDLPPAPAPEPPAAEEAVTPAAEQATNLYERALKVLREEQKYAEGRELMETFLKRYPEDGLAINAAYWIGEAYYAEKNYEKAILQFEDVVQTYGDHPKVAATLLKQGLSFDSLGDRASARLLLKRAMERFPGSEEAKKAAAILKEWGG